MTLRAALLGLFAALLLAACGTVPQPFRHEGEAAPTNPLLTLDSARGVAVIPPDGVDEKTAALLAEGMTLALGDAGIPTDTAQGENVLGRLMASGRVHVRALDANGLRVAIEWTLLGTGGEQIATHPIVVEMDERQWSRLSIAEAIDLAKAAAIAFAEILQDDPGPEVAKEDKPLIIFFDDIVGAPGNNGALLRNALMALLNESGAKTLRREEATDEIPDFIIGATVNGSPGDEDKTLLSVSWTVKDKTGKELGKVDLSNPIASRVYQAYWGPLAHDIAVGSVSGIAQIVNVAPE